MVFLGVEKVLGENKKKPSLPVVSRDIIREKFGIKGKFLGSKEFEERVTLEHRSQVDKLIREGREFVIDDTNLGTHTSSLIQYLRSKGVKEIIGVVFKTPLEICITRRKEIPEIVLRKMNWYIENFPWKQDLNRVINVYPSSPGR